jgi:hypothetical protein
VITWWKSFNLILACIYPIYRALYMSITIKIEIKIDENDKI